MGSAHLGILGSEAKALAVLWLQELVDDEERVIRIPVLKSKDLKQLRQNVGPPSARTQLPRADRAAADSRPSYLTVHQRVHGQDARVRDCASGNRPDALSTAS
jgi:hypothetical protein